MPVSQTDAKACKSLLWASEKVEMTVKQGRFRPGGSLLTPTSFVGTNHRLIIIDRESAGLRTNFEVIDYDHITSVKVERGILSASIVVRVEGLSSHTIGTEDSREEGVIDGVPRRKAEEFVDYLNKKLEREHMERETGPRTGV